MFSHVHTAALRGVDSILIDVEVNLGPGLPAFAVVGLPQGAVREGRERVGAALRNTGFPLPPRRITVNLAPGDVRKEGTSFDLAIAVGLLSAAGHVSAQAVEGIAFLGELGLDGSVRPVRGVLSTAARCRDEGLKAVVVPEANAAEAGVVRGIDVFGAGHLAEVVAHLRGRNRLPLRRTDPRAALSRSPRAAAEMADVRGQLLAKRAMEIAAAGSHNLLLIGPPGAGKTMMARRLPGILPTMTVEEALETSRVHSVAGLLSAGVPIVGERPFRAPHHTVSDAGLVGGGATPGPGEVSLAHNGVLFLDELTEFRRHVLDALREPLEEGEVHISRAGGSLAFPARVLLVGAMNPCPCGYWGDGSDRCRCDSPSVTRYLARVSGPVLDRIDLHLQVPAVPVEALSGVPPSRPGDPATTASIRGRVEAARTVQTRRFTHEPGTHANSQMSPPALRRWCRPGAAGTRMLHRAVDRLGLSARSYHRVLKVARTIADLDGVLQIGENHIGEALQYRALDRRMA